MTPDGKYDFYTCSLQVYKIDQYAFEGPAITIAGNGYVGCLHLADGKFNAYQRTYILSNFKACREFLYEEIGRELPAKVTREARNGNIPYIVRDMLTELEVSLPCSDEQPAIGRFFRKIDALISQQQKKVEKLQGIKKGLMERLFPRGGCTLPEVRFAGFDGEWVERKLGEIMEVASVKRIHQSDWRADGIRFLRARDIVAAFKNEELSDYLYISKEKYDEFSSVSGKVEIGDLLVTGVGTIGVPYLIESSEPVYFKDGNIIWFKNGKKIDDSFFFFSFESCRIQNFITDSAGIGTVGTYTIESGKKTPIVLPCHKEQSAIGRLFRKLDDLITLHGEKLEKLRHVKQALLGKMFV